MSFWANKLGVTPAVAPAPPQAPTGPAPWWQTATPQAQQQTFAPQQHQQQSYAPPMDPEAEAVARASSRARSAKESEFCPECASGDYFRANPRSVKRCYECGYTDSGRTWQAGSGDLARTIQGTAEGVAKQLGAGHTVVIDGQALPQGFHGKMVVGSV